MKKALTIAGSDPTGGAGIQADLKTFHACGVYGLSAIAALTAQNTSCVAATEPVKPSFLIKQLDTLLSDIRPDACKTGMLYSSDVITAVAEIIQTYDLKNLVVDPVTISSSGRVLIESGGQALLKQRLFPLARVITPNIPEASALAGLSIDSQNRMEEAAYILREMGPEVVIITGGHLEAHTIDLIYDGTSFYQVVDQKLPGEYHGTGCMYSAALTAYLAQGSDVVYAAERAHAVVRNAIVHAHALGRGMSLLNIHCADPSSLDNETK
jgi:hydroxymethylpyrimidine/phosphomethylpyrimidine kinase